MLRAQTGFLSVLGVAVRAGVIAASLLAGAPGVARAQCVTGVSIGTQPIAQVICDGSTLTLTVAATGSPAPTYRWQSQLPTQGFLNMSDGVNVSGALTNTVTISNFSPASFVNYRCRVTNACGTVDTITVRASTDTAPAVTTNPVSQTICPGDTLSFSVVATGTNLTYVWRNGNNDLITDGVKANGTIVSGATTSTITFTNAQDADIANFHRAVVSNACGSVDSLPGAVTFNTTPTSITTGPSAQTTCPGGTASFSVVAAGSGTLTYRWRKNSVNIDTVTNPSAATATLTLASAQAADAGSYDCVVGSDCGSITSAAATLGIGEPVFTLLPTNQSACTGESVVFTCEAFGNGFTYRWLRALQGSNAFVVLNNNADFSGVDTNTLTIANVQPGDSNATARYRVQAVSPCGTAGIPSPVTYTVDTTITTQPTDARVCRRGGTAVFTTVATGKNLTYRWARAIPPSGFLNLSDGGNISGALTPTLSISGITGPVNATYRCRVFSSCGNVDANFVVINYCPADFNCSGSVEVSDIFAFLTAWFQSSPSADYNADGSVNVQDIFDFLSGWFAGCA